MHAGRLSVAVKGASCTISSPDDEYYIAAHLPEGAGKACTESYLGSQLKDVKEEIVLHLGPASPRTLQVMLCRQAAEKDAQQGNDELIGEGSLALEGMDGDEKKTVKVQLVNKIGKHCGEVDVTLRLFPSRCPGTFLRTHAEYKNVYCEAVHS
jgi:hypothetical protein